MKTIGTREKHAASCHRGTEAMPEAVSSVQYVSLVCGRLAMLPGKTCNDNLQCKLSYTKFFVWFCKDLHCELLLQVIPCSITFNQC
jgi:hypothetical protein